MSLRREINVDPAAIFWANHDHSDHRVALDSFQAGLTVRLIATDRLKFVTCGSHEELSAVVARNRNTKFDFMPVVEEQRIVGLIELLSYRQGAKCEGLVRESMRALSDGNLIGGNASILAYIRQADLSPCCLVVSGTSISGLVSLSDLQKLPVRAALFGVVTYLEIVMTSSIRQEFAQSDEAIKQLSDARQALVREKCAKARKQDAFIDALLYTEFCDKVTIIKKRPKETWSKREFQRDMDRIQALRNNLAHANEYAASRESAMEVCGTVRLIDKWLTTLSKAATAGPEDTLAPHTK
jgi:hypothetical protein